MSETRYSVIMPVYNKRPHLARAVGSVLAQTQEDLELIVVDDASTDGSLEELAGLNDPRVRILSREKPGAGGYAARNLGAGRARSEWIAFLDADDEWDRRFLEEIDALRVRFPGARCACTGYLDVSSDGSSRPDAYSRLYAGRGAHTLELLSFVRESRSGRCPIRTSATALQRDILVESGGFPENRCRRGGDNDTWFRVLCRTHLAWSPYPGAVYYRNTLNMATRIVPPELHPCLEQTLREAIAAAPKRGRGRLLRREIKRLSNHEKKAAIKNRIRQGALRVCDLEGLYAGVEPFYALSVFLWAILPGGLSGRIVDLYRYIRGKRGA